MEVKLVELGLASVETRGVEPEPTVGCEISDAGTGVKQDGFRAPLTAPEDEIG